MRWLYLAGIILFSLLAVAEYIVSSESLLMPLLCGIVALLLSLLYKVELLVENMKKENK